MTFTTLTAGVFCPHDLNQALVKWHRIADTHPPTILLLGHSQLNQMRAWATTGHDIGPRVRAGLDVGEVWVTGIPVLIIRLLDRDYHGDEHLELL